MLLNLSSLLPVELEAGLDEGHRYVVPRLLLLGAHRRSEQFMELFDVEMSIF